MNEIEARIGGFQDRVVAVVGQLHAIAERARCYRDAGANVRFYVIGIGFGFAATLTLAPTAAVTALLLLLEYNLPRTIMERIAGIRKRGCAAVLVSAIWCYCFALTDLCVYYFKDDTPTNTNRSFPMVAVDLRAGEGRQVVSLQISIEVCVPWRTRCRA